MSHGTRYHLAVRAFEQGRIAYGRRELERLLGDPTLPGMLRTDVQYTLAIAFVETGEAAAVSLLESLRVEARTNDRIDSVSVLVELAGALVNCNRDREAYDRATEGIELAVAQRRPEVVGRINRGIAARSLGWYGEAVKDLVEAVRGARLARHVQWLGAAAEQLGRTEVARQRPHAAARWCSVARLAFERAAPHSLRSVAAVEGEIAAMALFIDAGDEIDREVDRAEEFIGAFSAVDASEHLSTLDIDLYAFLSAVGLPGCNVSIPLQTDTLDDTFELLKAEIATVRPHPMYPQLIADTKLAVALNVTREALPPFESIADSATAPLIGQHVQLYWENAHAWPHGLGPRLSALLLLYRGGAELLKKRAAEFDAMSVEMPMQFLGTGARNWPLVMQMKYIGLGQFSTGLIAAPPHLLETTVRLKLRDRDSNRDGFRLMGYSREESENLVAGGLVSINATEIGRFVDKNLPYMLGGLPLNEFNLANLPAAMELPERDRRPGFFLDRHYQGWFFAVKPRAAPAYYGAKNDFFRDHFAEFRSGLEIAGSYRAKHYAIPIIRVSSRDELFHIAARLPEFDGQVAWYRGQTTQFSFRRPPAIARILFGREDVEELSLPGAAPRRGLAYDDVQATLQTLVQDHVYEMARRSGRDSSEVHRDWLASLATWDFDVMALAQHYGIPTHGLDITSSLEVALWFATHRFGDGAGGRKTYRRMTIDQWPAEAAKWPAVYIVLPVTHTLRPSVWKLESSRQTMFDAFRPQRQHGAFFMGAHGSHQNRLSESIACILQLAPGDWPCSVTYRELFPPPDEDVAYAFMLDVKRRYSAGPLGRFFSEIAEYGYE
jgi:hypothetical protein